MALNRVNDPGRVRHQMFRRNTGPFQVMQKDPCALDRLDICFRWGRYGIQVLRYHLSIWEPGTTIPPHQHGEYEFHFVPWGQGTLTLDDGAFPLHAGLLYLTGPQVMHRQDIDFYDPMNELCLHVNIVELDTELISDLSDESSWGGQLEMLEADECMRQLNAMPAYPTPDRYGAMSCFLTSFMAWYNRDPGAYITIRQSIVQILLRVAHAYAIPQIHTALPSRDMTVYRYQLATQYIRDNYARPITLGEVADELHVCGRQIQRIMAEHANETFSGYLEHYRLSQVCQSLTHTDLPVEQMAIQHGFSSGSYLHRVFKKRLGLTPLQYRERQRLEKKTSSQ